MLESIAGHGGTMQALFRGDARKVAGAEPAGTVLLHLRLNLTADVAAERTAGVERAA